MIESLPDYVADRIRRPLPTGQHVVADSTPVIAFGDTRTASIATVGLNPSKNEFRDRHGQLLLGAQRRLETLPSLAVPSLAGAPDAAVAQVWQRCATYFQHNPYWTWFGQLEPLLQALDTSYKTGTACHLDLVQWATDPVWAKIPSASTRAALIQADAAFLYQQLLHEPMHALLLNGNSVIQAFQAMYAPQLRWHPTTLTDRSATTRLVLGFGPRDVALIGWTINIQSSFGVTRKLRHMLAHTVATLLPQLQRSGT